MSLKHKVYSLERYGIVEKYQCSCFLFAIIFKTVLISKLMDFGVTICTA